MIAWYSRERSSFKSRIICFREMGVVGFMVLGILDGLSAQRKYARS
jgi:hypothetical protein